MSAATVGLGWLLRDSDCAALRTDAAFETAFKVDMATLLSISQRQVSITGVSPGSIVVAFELAPTPGTDVSVPVNTVTSALVVGVTLAGMTATEAVSEVISAPPPSVTDEMLSDLAAATGLATGVLVLIVVVAVACCGMLLWYPNAT